jgi:hypothetical protein
MIVFTATEALSPAIERTRRLLFAPFRWGTFLKLCAVAVLTEGFGGNFNFSGPSHSSSHQPANSPSLTTTSFSSSTLSSGLSRFSLTPGWIALIAAGALLALAIGILLFYLITRLRFSLFYCLAYQVKELRPGWTLYREQANRFFLFNLVVGLVFMVLTVLAIAPFAVGLFQVFRSTHAGERFDFALFFSLFIPLFALIFVIALLAIAVDIVLRDFMLPHFALEDTSAGEAWAEVRTRIAAEKGSFFLYAVLRILLPIAAAIALFMILAIPMLIVFAALAVIFVGIHTMFTGSLAFAGIVLEALIGLAAVAVGLFLAICFGGPLSLWVRNFALVFYGGRYRLLGDVIFPPRPPALFDGGDAPAV